MVKMVDFAAIGLRRRLSCVLVRAGVIRLTFIGARYRLQMQPFANSTPVCVNKVFF